jgi:hypothetical protein
LLAYRRTFIEKTIAMLGKVIKSRRKTGTIKDFRAAICAALVATQLVGCAHNPLNYPNSPISGINPSDYIDNPCSDFSGTYQGVGHLIDGDPSSMRSALAQQLRFDMIFPIISDPDGWQNIQNNYQPVGYGNKPADYAEVEQLGPRSVEITMSYRDRVIGSYRSDYKNPNKFICKKGELIAGGPDRISSQSELGKNSSGESDALYKDKDGNLIYENYTYVQMTWLDVIPTGTARYYVKYIFKKLHQHIK